MRLPLLLIGIVSGTLLFASGSLVAQPIQTQSGYFGPRVMGGGVAGSAAHSGLGLRQMGATQRGVWHGQQGRLAQDPFGGRLRGPTPQAALAPGIQPQHGLLLGAGAADPALAAGQPMVGELTGQMVPGQMVPGQMMAPGVGQFPGAAVPGTLPGVAPAPPAPGVVADPGTVQRLRVPVDADAPRAGLPATQPVRTEFSRRLEQRLARLPAMQDAGEIQVWMDGSTAVLSGQVASAPQGDLAARLVLLEPGVEHVRNELRVNALMPSNELQLEQFR